MQSDQFSCCFASDKYLKYFSKFLSKLPIQNCRVNVLGKHCLVSGPCLLSSQGLNSFYCVNYFKFFGDQKFRAKMQTNLHDYLNFLVDIIALVKNSDSYTQQLG